MNNAMRLGYYCVGGTIHLNKISALIDSTKRNIHPEWVFNNDVFDTVDWTVEPEESLSELYAQRAQQIRDKHDYVVLSYSGGSDSQNILNTFLNNNIPLDEIIVSWPVALAESMKANPFDASADNQISEWELTIKPKLRRLAQYHPEIKISIYDWAGNYESYKINDDYVISRNINLALYSGLRWDYKNMPEVDRALAKHNNAIVITGTCKPRVCWHNDQYRLYFIDLVGSGSVDPANQERTEYFYWHPEAWKIVAKQAQLVRKFFETNPMMKQFIQWPAQTSRGREFYETAIRAIIYPELDLHFFQGAKWPDFTHAWDGALSRIDNRARPKIQDFNATNMSYLKQVIDPKYFQPGQNHDKIVGFITGMWALAK